MTTRVQRAQIGNAILIGVALALVVLVLTTRTTPTTSEQDLRSSNLLQVYRESDITRIRVERKNAPFTLVRASVDDAGDSTWKLTEPVQEDAEPLGVQQLLGTLEFASFIRRIKPEEVNRKAFGLDDPSLVIHVDMGSIKYRLRLGAEAASPKGARYLEIAGESAPGQGVALVTKSLSAELDASGDELRERYVMPYLSSVLSGIVISGEGGVKRLARAPWLDGFRFDGMLGDARANRAALDRVLLQFARTRAERFIGVAEARQALATGPRVDVTLLPTNPKNPKGEVTVGGKCPGNDAEVVALRRAPDEVAACVPRSVLAGLAIPAESLVDHTLFWMRGDEVESFEVSQGNQKLQLDRKENGFLIRAPREGAVEGDAGSARLDALLRATGTVVPNPDRARLGLEPPTGRALVRSAAAEDSQVREELVKLGAPQPGGKIYVERAHDGVVLELERDAARAVVPDAAILRARSLLDIALVDVTGVEIDGPVKQDIARSQGGAFTYRAPVGFTVDTGLALELCDALRSLSAERWVAESDDGSFGFAASTHTARIRSEKQGTAEEHVVRLGGPAGSGRYAKLDADPGVFVLSRRTYEALTTLALDRGVFMLDPAITTRVTLQTESRTLVLERLGDEFVEANPGPAPLSPEAISRITDTLTTLRAEAAIDLGPPHPEHGMGRPALTVRVELEPGHEGKPLRVVWRAGAGDSWRGMSVHYARVDGVDATYVVARSGVRALLDAL